MSDDDRWAAAPGIKLQLGGDLLRHLELETGVPPGQAAAILRPALESGELVAEVPSWPAIPAFRPRHPEPVRRDWMTANVFRVMPEGWSQVDWAHGTVCDHPILVDWRDAERLIREYWATLKSRNRPKQQAVAEPARSGMPGRPTSSQLIRQEFNRRVQNGSACATLKAEALELHAWLTAEHPDAHPCKPKTIENNLRSEYRRHFEAPKQTPK